MTADRYSPRLTTEGWQIFDTSAGTYLADTFGEWWHALEESDRLNQPIKERTT